MALLIIGVCATLSYASGQCVQQNCFDCNTCKKNCTGAALRKNCDSDCLVSVKTFLCQMENENCVKANGCDIAPVPVTLFPAAGYSEAQANWKPQTIQASKNCCYKLSGDWDNTLSGLKTTASCVQFYDNYDCTGTSIIVDSSWSNECLKWIDCDEQFKKRGAFNDKASSFKLC